MDLLHILLNINVGKDIKAFYAKNAPKITLKLLSIYVQYVHKIGK